MKAIRMHEFGHADVLKYEEVPDPEPAAGQVVLDIKACALNHVEVDIREGISRFPVPLPIVPGLEVVGTISAIGDGVDGWSLGQRVVPYLLGGGETFLGVTANGGYAEKMACPASMLLPVPDAVSDVDAAALQIAFGTSWHMLFNRGRLAVGETVMINSVASGIGSAAVVLAKLAGAYVIGNASTDAKLEKAKALGMDVGINHTREDVAARVMEITGGQGVDLVYEHVGGKLFQAGLDSLTFAGRMVTCGGHAQEVVDFDIIPFFRSQKSVIGSFVYDRDEAAKVYELAARGQIKAIVDSTFPLERAADAQLHMESREHFGKIVLVP